MKGGHHGGGVAFRSVAGNQLQGAILPLRAREAMEGPHGIHPVSPVRLPRPTQQLLLPGQLLSLSMVWANHFFLGCSYNKDLLDNVMEMSDGVEVADQS